MSSLKTSSSLLFKHLFRLFSDIHVYYVASFPGPAQISIACSMESTGWAWERGYVLHIMYIVAIAIIEFSIRTCMGKTGNNIALTRKIFLHLQFIIM